MNTENVVLCEGYHDRAFLAGWLESLRLEPPPFISGTAERRPLADPGGKSLEKGQIGYYTPSNQFVRIVPCGGDVRKMKIAAKYWLDRAKERHRNGAAELELRHLLLCIDSDAQADDGPAAGRFAIQEFISWLWEFDGSAESADNGQALLFGGATTASLIRWSVDGPTPTGIPSKQTLERLVCSAIVAAYPERGKPVQHWLESRPNAPEAGPKEFAWSHMAGWFAEAGSDTFFRKLWRDPAIVEQLTLQLKGCGAWDVVEALAK